MDVAVVIALVFQGAGLVAVGVWAVGKIVATTEGLRASILALERSIERLDGRVTAIDARTVVLGERTAGLESAARREANERAANERGVK